MNKRFLFILAFLLPMMAVAQSGLLLELRGGLESGWWVYDKGSDVAGQENTLGWDRTRHSGFLPFSLNAWYSFSKWRLGAGFEYGYFDEYNMFSSESRLGNPLVYRIAERGVISLKYFIQGEVDLIRRKRFVCGPQLALGSFQIKTIHPQKDNFGFRMLVHAAFVLRFGISDRLEIFLAPSWKRQTIWPDVKTVLNEQHELQSYGINGGIRFQVLGGKR